MPAQERLVIVGCGTVGLPLAVAFAIRDFDVLGFDVDDKKIAALEAGVARIEEAGLAAAFSDARARGRLNFTSSLAAAASEPRSFVIAVGTPAEDGVFDRRPFDAALAAVSGVARSGDTVILRSTLPIGTTAATGKLLQARGLDCFVAYCPDRTVVGRSFGELFEIPHLIGGIDARALHRAAALFSRLGAVIEVSSSEAAEAAKLFSNVQREVSFALANECALLCENLGLDAHEIVAASRAGYPRQALARPGPVGGPCLPKDPALLAASLNGGEATIAASARAVNRRLLDHVSGVVCRHLAGRELPVAAMLGIAFKGHPPTGDTRGSFAVALARRLKEVRPGLALRAFDPEVPAAHIASLGMEPGPDPYAAAAGADVAIVANDHPALFGIEPARMAAMMRSPALLYDLCGSLPRQVSHMPDGAVLRILGDGSRGTETERGE